MAARDTEGPVTAGAVMLLLDSNIIIYAVLGGGDFLSNFVSEHSPFVSDISRVEVLGFQNITSAEKDLFYAFFKSASLISISEEIIVEAIKLRQQKKMGLGDSLIAATAIVEGMTLVTRNTKDFKWINALSVLDPMEDR